MSEQIDPHILSQYIPIQRVGKGAYGVVWKATEKQTGKILALKKVFDAFNNVTDAQRTYREVIFLKQMKHPNIIELYKTYPANNNRDLYMTFAYMETDLHVAIRANVLQQVHRRFIVYQTLKALKYMHSAGVIHRDLKPANILLDSQCTAKLADFGLARSVGFHDETDSVLTEYVATRWFRSPEILIGSHNYSFGVDMWSLGCIMGEMIIGKALFPGSSTLNQLEKIIDLIGSPNEKDLISFQSEFAIELFGNLPTKQRPRLDQLLANNNSTPEEIDLLKKFLIYDPSKRISVQDALKHPFLSQFQNEEEEIDFKGQIQLGLDDNKQFKIDDYRDVLYEREAQKQKEQTKTSKTNIDVYREKQNLSKLTELIKLQKKIQPKKQSLSKSKSRPSTADFLPKNQKSPPRESNDLFYKVNQEKTVIVDQLEEQFDNQKVNNTILKDVSQVQSVKNLKNNSQVKKQVVNVQSVKSLLTQKFTLSPKQKIQTSPGSQVNKCSNFKSPFNYGAYLKQYQQKANKSNTNNDQEKILINSRPLTSKLDSALNLLSKKSQELREKSKERKKASRQLSSLDNSKDTQAIQNLEVKKMLQQQLLQPQHRSQASGQDKKPNTFTQKNESIANIQKNVEQQARQWNSTLYQRQSFKLQAQTQHQDKGTGASTLSFHQKNDNKNSYNFYKVALNYTSTPANGNRILSNLTNTSIQPINDGIKQSNLLNKSQHYLAKLLKKM